MVNGTSHKENLMSSNLLEPPSISLIKLLPYCWSQTQYNPCVCLHIILMIFYMLKFQNSQIHVFCNSVFVQYSEQSRNFFILSPIWCLSWICDSSELTCMLSALKSDVSFFLSIGFLEKIYVVSFEFSMEISSMEIRAWAMENSWLGLLLLSIWY